MKRRIRCALGLALMLGCCAMARASVVDDVLTPVPPPRIDSSAAAAFRERLEEHVARFLDHPDYAPLVYLNGRAGAVQLFAQSSDTIGAISRAYPYLSPALQKRAKAYLLAELRERPPYNRTACFYDPAGRRRREYAPLSRDLKAARPPALGLGALYSLWLLADRTDAYDAVKELWPDIRATLEQPPATDFTIDRQNGHWAMNQMVAGLIAYVRFADRYHDAEAVTSGRARLATALEQLSAYWKERRLSATEAYFGGVAPAAGRALVVFADQTARADAVKGWSLACLTGLRPEVARFLAVEPLRGNVLTLLSAIDEVGPTWYAVWSENYAQRGGAALVWPDEAPGILYAKAVIEGAPLDKLSRFADIPLCDGDMFYVERLVTLIERTGA